MDGIDAKGQGQIEPLPEFLPYQAFAYSAENLRSRSIRRWSSSP
jgi:Tfp pilus assembly protein PilP